MPTAETDPLLALTVATRETIYADIRERQPVYWSQLRMGWVLTRFADVSAVLRRPDAIAFEIAPTLAQVSARRGGPDLTNLTRICSAISFMTGPPRHDALRRFVTGVIAGVQRMDMGGILNAKAASLLDEGERVGGIDLAEGYGRELALFTMSRFLQIEHDKILHLGQLARDLTGIFESAMPPLRVLVTLEARAKEMIECFLELIVERRRAPGEDGLSLLIRLADAQFGCDDEELASYCAFFFVTGEETTAAGNSSAVRLLLQRPALRESLIAEPARLPAAVRELARLASPVQYVGRKLPMAVEINGMHIEAGQRFALILGAANRDPAAFPNPDEADLNRGGPDPIDFAAGPYRCVGRQLALFESEIVLRNILARPDLHLSTKDQPIWVERMNLASLRHLPAQFGAQE